MPRAISGENKLAWIFSLDFCNLPSENKVICMLRVFLFLFSVLLLSSCASMQELSKHGITISPRQIAVINETDSLQLFFIGEESEHLFETRIEPGQTWISHDFSGRPHIRLYVGGKYEEYLLMPGLLYRLYWDNRKRRPDIKMYSDR